MVEPSSSGGADSAVASSSKSGGASGGAPKCHMDTLDLSDPAVLATMTADELKKFIDTGRTGRRNALHDVSETASASTSAGAALTDALESLSVQDDHRTDGKT